MTARQLLDELIDRGVVLTVSGEELEVAGDVPHNLSQFVAVLQTGLRALLSGRKWWGSGSERPRVEAISCDRPIPEWVGLLCCEGDGSTWDRLPADARIDYPELFEGGKVLAVA